MFCPVCGQEQVSDATRFCSRCGFLMAGVPMLVANGGILPGAESGGEKPKESPKMRGVKQGALLFLSGIVLVPVLGILTVAIGAEPYLVGITAILCFLGGLLRMLYAALFEEGAPKLRPMANPASLYGRPQTPQQNVIPGVQSQAALPPQQSIPADAYTGPGRWRETNDLAEPGSVVDGTTQLLEKDPER